MTEEIVAEKILEALKKEKYCVISIRELFKLWFNETNGLQDELFTRKLKDFSNKRHLDYVIIMSENMRNPEFIKFWKVNEIGLLEEGHE